MKASEARGRLRVLALDPGRRRTGIALSDPSGRLATPLETVEFPLRKLVAHVHSLIERHEVGLVVVGLPKLPSGQKGEIAGLSEEVAARLRRSAGVQVLLWDEALTSWEAEHILRGGGAWPDGPARDRRKKDRGKGSRRTGATGKRKRRPAGAIDQLAAALLLQDYLDAQRSASPPAAAREGDHEEDLNGRGTEKG